MQFPFPRSVGSVVQQIATNGRRHLISESVGLSSMRKGEGSLDVLDENGDVEAPLEVFGTLPDGTTGWGTKIDGAVVNFRNWAGQQLSDLADRITVEKNRNDSQDNTLASHNTRITNAQTTADTANNKVDTLDDKFMGLKNQVDGLGSASGSQTADIADLTARLKRVFTHLGWAWDYIGA